MISELQQERLQILLNDDFLLKTIMIILNEMIENEKPKIVDTDNNSILGEKFRAYELSRQILNKMFQDLLSYKISKKDEKSFDKSN